MSPSQDGIRRVQFPESTCMWSSWRPSSSSTQLPSQYIDVCDIPSTLLCLHILEILEAALAVVATTGKEGARVMPLLSSWWLAFTRWMKKSLVSLSQVVHCNPAEVAYRAHCLSHCCLSSFPTTDSSPRTHRHTHSVKDFFMHLLSS